MRAIFLLLLLTTACGANRYYSGPGFELREDQIRIDDMIFNKRAIQTFGADGFASYLTAPWPAGVVPVKFEGVTSAHQLAFWAACNKWKSVAGVNCRPTLGGVEKYLLIREVSSTSYTCLSEIGYNDKAPHVTIVMDHSADCWREHSVLHELGHALGFLHEHQRPDRDNYVTINWANLSPGAFGAFDILSMRLRTSYDFLSVMHYQAWAFSINGQQTIVPKSAYAQYTTQLGTATLPSAGDKQALVSIYGTSLVAGHWITEPTGCISLRCVKVMANVYRVQVRWCPNDWATQNVVRKRLTNSNWSMSNYTALPMSQRSYIDPNVSYGQSLVYNLKYTPNLVSAYLTIPLDRVNCPL